LGEVTDLIWYVLVGVTGFYFLHTAPLTRGNPHDSVIRTLLWSFQLILGLSMFMFPFLQWGLDRLIK